jgi:uncharacterized membrane-anchored protein
MNATTQRLALLGALLLVSAAAWYAVQGHERTLRSGRIVLVELAPVDPRSLMQGDYMALRFQADSQLPRPEAVAGRPPKMPAYAYLALDASDRATYVATGDALPAPVGQVALRLRARDAAYSIGPNAFFFQEGRADAYAQARWGEFRVEANGKALLTHLRDADLHRLGDANRR